MMYPHTIIPLIWWEQLVFLPWRCCLIINYHWSASRKSKPFFSTVFQHFSSSSWQWGLYCGSVVLFIVSLTTISYFIVRYALLGMSFFSPFAHYTSVFLLYITINVINVFSFFLSLLSFFVTFSVYFLCHFSPSPLSSIQSPYLFFSSFTPLFSHSPFLPWLFRPLVPLLSAWLFSSLSLSFFILSRSFSFVYLKINLCIPSCLLSFPYIWLIYI